MLTEKEKAIRKVLEKRMEVIEEYILPSNNQSPLNLAYYEGKRDGYQQALDLLNDSLESIKVELV